MERHRLAELIERSQVRRKILGTYKGGYALGLMLNPENQNELAIGVSIEGGDASSISRCVILEGQVIPVIVETNFERLESAAWTV